MNCFGLPAHPGMPPEPVDPSDPTSRLAGLLLVLQPSRQARRALGLWLAEPGAFKCSTPSTGQPNRGPAHLHQRAPAMPRGQQLQTSCTWPRARWETDPGIAKSDMANASEQNWRGSARRRFPTEPGTHPASCLLPPVSCLCLCLCFQSNMEATRQPGPGPWTMDHDLPTLDLPGWPGRSTELHRNSAGRPQLRHTLASCAFAHCMFALPISLSLSTSLQEADTSRHCYGAREAKISNHHIDRRMRSWARQESSLPPVCLCHPQCAALFPFRLCILGVGCICVFDIEPGKDQTTHHHDNYHHPLFQLPRLPCHQQGGTGR